MQEITIVQATIHHLDAVAQLFDQYRQFYEQEENLTASKQFIQERIQNQESVIFLALNQEGENLGFTQLYPTFSSVSIKKDWLLNDLYVSPSARKQGVARKLMDRAKKLAIETGAKGITLETHQTNYSAQALYESLGYQQETEFFIYFLKV